MHFLRLIRAVAVSNLIRKYIGEGRAALRQQRAAALIPELDIGSFSFYIPGTDQTRPGPDPQTVFREGFGTLHHVRLNDPSVLEGIVTQDCLERNRFVLKRHVEMHRVMRSMDDEQRTAACAQLARGVWLADSAALRGMGGVVPLCGYGFDSEGIPFVLTRQEDFDVGVFFGIIDRAYSPADLARTLGIPQPRASEIITRLGQAYPGTEGRSLAVRNAVLSMARNVMQLHAQGLVHRDIKPESFVMDLETAVRMATDLEPFLRMEDERPFTMVIDWDTAYARGEIEGLLPSTTTLYDRPFGTLFYMPLDLITDPTPEKLRHPSRDSVALGWCIEVLDGRLHLPRGRGEMTQLYMRDNVFSIDPHPLPDPAAQQRREALRRIALHATRKGYPAAGQLYEDLLAAFSGRPEEVLSRADIRESWKSRHIPELRLATHREAISSRSKLRRKIALGALTLSLGAGLVAAAYLDEYRRSPQHAARQAAAAGLSPASLEKYDKSIVNALKHDDALFASRRTLPATKRVPSGSFASIEGGQIQYWTGADMDVSGVVSQYLVGYMLSKDSALLEPLAFYLDEMRFELAGPKGTDWRSSPIGRFEPIVRYRHLLESLHGTLAAQGHPSAGAIGRALAKSEYAARLAVRQFADRWGTMRYPVRVAEEYQLDPLVFEALLHPEVFQEHSGPDRFRGESLVRQQLHTPPDLRSALLTAARSGRTLCTLLVQPDGRSFSMASLSRNGKVVRSIATENDPGYGMPEQHQAVLMADHTALMALTAYRSHVIGRFLQGSDGHAAMLRGYAAGDPQLAGELEEAQRELDACGDALGRYYLAHTGEGRRMPPEYVMRSIAAAKFMPLGEDATSMGRYLQSRLVAGGDVREGLTVLFSSARMRTHVGWMPGMLLGWRGWSYLPGFPDPYAAADGTQHRGFDFPDSRWYTAEHHGPNALTTGLLRRIYFEYRTAQ